MFSRLAVSCLLAATGAAALGQDVDILISNEDGVLTVAGNALSPGEGRTYIPRFNSFYSVNDPGFRASPGDLPNNGALEWDFLPMTIDGLTSNLLYWDGQGGVPSFGSTPTAEYSLALFGRNNAKAAAAGESDLVTGQIYDFASSVGSLHEHRSFFLDNDLNDQNFTTADAGFYLIAMRLRADERERSDPFYLAWGTPDSDIDTHRDVVLPWLQASVDTLVLPGDHNFDGSVDAADYTVWRDGSGVTHSAIDLEQWRVNYGASSGSLPALAAIPEPTGIWLICLGFSGILFAVGRDDTPNR